MSSRPRVLLVEEDPELKDLFELAFGCLDAIVDTTCDGAEALSRMGSEAYDLVVSEVLVPTLDGVELLSIARRRLSMRGAFVLLTASEDYSVDELVSMGADGVQEKPLDPSLLVDLAQRWLTMGIEKRASI